MNFAQVTDLIAALQKTGAAAGQRTALLLLGAPGIGKTSAARNAAARMQAEPGKHPVVEVLDLTSMLPEDLLGLPGRTPHSTLGSVTEYAAPAWLAACCAPGATGVLVLDDLPAAAVAVQVAARQIVLEHRVHEHRLARGIQVVVTGNRREDKSSASRLPAHFMNSVLTITVEPVLDEWARWHYSREGADPAVAHFLRFKPEHFSQLPKDADRVGAFASPRTWSILSELMAAGVCSASRDPLEFQEIASGLVGEGIAAELTAFLTMSESLVPPEKLMENPEAALPDPVQFFRAPALEGGGILTDRMIATTSALGHLAATQWKEAIAQRRPAQPIVKAYLRALAWVTRQGASEYAVSSYFVLTSSMGAAYTTPYTNERGVSVLAKGMLPLWWGEEANVNADVRDCMNVLIKSRS